MKSFWVSNITTYRYLNWTKGCSVYVSSVIQKPIWGILNVWTNNCTINYNNLPLAKYATKNGLKSASTVHINCIKLALDKMLVL